MRGTSKTYQYLVRIKKFYSDLVSQGKMKEPTKESFFKDYLDDITTIINVPSKSKKGKRRYTIKHRK